MVKYVHTNIVSNDWKKLAGFYEKVFGCEALYPERNLKGEWIDQLTNLKNAHIRGIHLHLPGYNHDGPTLEIFQYNERITSNKPMINRPGFTHIAFSVDDVDFYLNKILDNGGKKYGHLVKKEIEGIGTIVVIYACDPEGNIIELQSWEKGAPFINKIEN